MEQDGAWVDLGFTGGTWEMEDQRNWLDASFKTYFRPLSLPYPYEISGEFSQSVTVRFGCETAAATARPTSRSTLDVGPLTALTVPQFGLRSDDRFAADELANVPAFAALGPFAGRFALVLLAPPYCRCCGARRAGGPAGRP
jgi:hypothetical protein